MDLMQKNTIVQIGRGNYSHDQYMVTGNSIRIHDADANEYVDFMPTSSERSEIMRMVQVQEDCLQTLRRLHPHLA